MADQEYSAFIEQRCKEIHDAIFSAVAKMWQEREDSKSWTPELVSDCESYIFMNFKDGIGFCVSIELDHLPGGPEV